MSRTLVVNTRSGKVHREDCTVLNNLSTGGMRWFTAWVGVARSDSDTACRYCLPDGLPKDPEMLPLADVMGGQDPWQATKANFRG